MRKAIRVLTLSAILIIAFAFTALAAWKQDAKGWRWSNPDGSYSTNAWIWDDSNNDGLAECYYCDAQGYVLTNTTTPDGYQVNADGAWVVNGVVQTKAINDGINKNAATNYPDNVPLMVGQSMNNVVNALNARGIVYLSDGSFIKWYDNNGMLHNYGFDSFGKCVSEGRSCLATESKANSMVSYYLGITSKLPMIKNYRQGTTERYQFWSNNTLYSIDKYYFGESWFVVHYTISIA